MTEDQIFSKVYDLLAKAYGTEEVRSEFKNKLKKSLDKEMVNLIRKGIVLFNAKYEFQSKLIEPVVVELEYKDFMD